MAHLALKVSAPPSASDQVENTNVNARTVNTALTRFFILFSPANARFKHENSDKLIFFAVRCKKHLQGLRGSDCPDRPAAIALRANRDLLNFSADTDYQIRGQR